MQAFAKRTIIAIALISSTLLAACGTASAANAPNVEMYYGMMYAQPELVSNNSAFTGSGWTTTNDYGTLVTFTKHGTTFVRLDLKRGTKSLWSWADYGTIRTPTFRNEAWDGKGAIPLYKTLTANGQKYSIRLSGIFVGGYNKHLPEPPAKGGCDVIVCK